MRIALCGKGGSGKTTVSALLAESLAAQGRPVLAVDADINQNLGSALGFKDAELNALPALGTDTAVLRDVVRGRNPLIPSDRVLVKTSPPGPGGGLIRLTDDDPVLRHYAGRRGSLSFIRVGGFDNADIGTHCYHSKTGALELMLNHTLDRPDETIIVDMTAGADSFASGLFTRFDLTVLVVEPTLNAVSVLAQYMDHARDHGVNIAAVGNKVADEADLRFLQDRAGNRLLTWLSPSALVRARDKGLRPALTDSLEPQNAAALEKIHAAARAQERDWDRYWAQAVSMHLKNAESWANAMTGANLATQIQADYLKTLRP